MKRIFLHTIMVALSLLGALTISAEERTFIVDGVEYHFQDGVAHILEHYVVECNETGNFLKLLGEKQMNTNASTHLNMTDFYFETVEDVTFGIQTMLNGIYNVKFIDEKLEKIG